MLPFCRDHVLVNKGVGATSSGIFSACIEHMLPQVGQLGAAPCFLVCVAAQLCLLLGCVLHLVATP